MSLAVYNGTVLRQVGDAVQLVAGAHIEVRREIPGKPLASLYSDRAGATPLGNPFDADANGAFSFFAAGGAYEVRAYLGDTGAPTYEVFLNFEAVGLSAETDDVGVPTQRDYVDSATLVMAADEVEQVNINKTVAGATRAVYPLAADRIPKKSIRVVDKKKDALTNPIRIVPKRPDVVTISIATPGVVSLAAHGIAANEPVSFETTGALPTGLVADTQYYAKTILTSGTFTVSETPGGAAINTTGSQSGVHTMGTDTIMGGAYYDIESNGGSFHAVPFDDGSGWA